MIQPPQLPTHARITLDQFLSFTGWNVPSPAHHRGMQVALDFFQDQIPAALLRQPVPDPSPWALPRGNVVKLCELMHAIDFARPVEQVVVPANTRLKAFLARDVGKHARPRGNYYSFVSATPGSLAIPHNQDTSHVYLVEVPAPALRSSVADAYVDWARKRAVNPAPPEYRHGGGVQLFIWDAFRFLRHV